MRQAALHLGNHWPFFGAHFLSAFAHEFAFFAMTLHAYGKHGRATDVAIFSAITFLPRLFAPLLGNLIDRFPQGRLFAATLALAAGAAALLSLGTWELVPWGCLAVLAVLFSLVRTALLTRVVRADGYLRVNAAVLFSLNAARLAAPLAGAAVAAWAPPTAAFLAAGGLFLLASLAAWHIRGASSIAVSACEAKESLLAGFRRGLAELWQRAELRFLFLLSLGWRLFLGLQISLFLVFVKQRLGGSDAAYGIFMTWLGLGSAAGSVAGPWLARRLSAPQLTRMGMGLHFAAFAWLSQLHAWSAAVAVMAVGFACLHAAVVGAHTTRDAGVPEDLRGRLFGVNAAILAVATMVSMLAGGALADRFGAPAVFLGGAMLSLALLAVLSLPQRSTTQARRPQLG